MYGYNEDAPPISTTGLIFFFSIVIWHALTSIYTGIVQTTLTFQLSAKAIIT